RGRGQWLQRVIVAFVCHPCSGEFPQLAVNEGKQLRGRQRPRSRADESHRTCIECNESWVLCYGKAAVSPCPHSDARSVCRHISIWSNKFEIVRIIRVNASSYSAV